MLAGPEVNQFHLSLPFLEPPAIYGGRKKNIFNLIMREICAQ